MQYKITVQYMVLWGSYHRLIPELRIFYQFMTETPDKVILICYGPFTLLYTWCNAAKHELKKVQSNVTTVHSTKTHSCALTQNSTLFHLSLSDNLCDQSWDSMAIWLDHMTYEAVKHLWVMKKQSSAACERSDITYITLYHIEHSVNSYSRASGQ